VTLETIAAGDYARRLRAILGHGASGHLPRRRRDQWILLHAIARAFGPDERLAEREATERIHDFLLGPGEHLEVDAVTLRRALVDDGFVDRDPAGRDYRASARHERFVRFAGEMPSADEALAGGERLP
jgi:hypothetical protein